MYLVKDKDAVKSLVEKAKTRPEHNFDTSILDKDEVKNHFEGKIFILIKILNMCLKRFQRIAIVALCIQEIFITLMIYFNNSLLNLSVSLKL
jgi:hypothetical protein